MILSRIWSGVMLGGVDSLGFPRTNISANQLIYPMQLGKHMWLGPLGFS